jgi:UDP:flavonoid glycosyltransferase YjiC (YdhE family)
MKVVLAPVGSRGDVEPMIALGVGLRRAGHHVTLFVAENYKDAVEGQLLRYARGGRDVQAVAKAEGESVRNPLTVIKLTRISVAEQFELLPAAAEGADLIVGTLLTTAGPSVAEKLKIPYAWASYFPNSFPTDELPATLVSRATAPKWFNRLSWWLQGAMTNVGLRKVVNTFRARWGLAPVRDLGDHRMTSGPAMLAFDRAITQPPSTNKLKVHVTGCWFLDSHEPVPPDVDAFINAGPPPIYIGFGSMPCADPVKRTRDLEEAVRVAGRRALISKGWGGLGAGLDGKTCLAVGPLNHAALFPRMAAVVHHGGAGTTHATARAGIPQVVVPHMYDQFHWAHCIERAGIGVGMTSSKFTGAQLGEALKRALGDAQMAAKARQVGETIRRSDGVGEAIRIMEALVPPFTSERGARAPSDATRAPGPLP